MANRKIVQEKNFLLGWDDAASAPVFSSDHGATWTPIVTGTGAVDIEENGVLVLASANPIDFQTDIAGGKEFAEVIDDGGGGVEVEIDKQINYLNLAGAVGPEPTGFTFVRTIYRACEVIYTIRKFSGELETGHIMILHDGTVAGVVVTRRGTELLPFTQGDPGVQFSADVLGTLCRLLYTETNGDDFHFAVKPRPIRLLPAPQIVTIQFVQSGSFSESSVLLTHTIGIEISTSDGMPVAAPGGAGGGTLDTGLGSATPGIDYDYLNPSPTWLVGALDGDVVLVDLEVLGTNVDATVVIDLSVLFGCVLGVNTQHTVTLFSVGA